jgi:hypothetical protein
MREPLVSTFVWGATIRAAMTTPQVSPLAEPSAQPGDGAGVADPRVVEREAAVTLQCVLEGSSGRDLAEIDPESQFREPIREPNPKGAGGGGLAVGQAGVPGRRERLGEPVATSHEGRSSPSMHHQKTLKRRRRRAGAWNTAPTRLQRPPIESLNRYLAGVYVGATLMFRRERS